MDKSKANRIEGGENMKEFLATIGLLIVGLFIGNIIIGEDDSSIKSASRNLMQAQIGALSD